MVILSYSLDGNDLVVGAARISQLYIIISTKIPLDRIPSTAIFEIYIFRQVVLLKGEESKRAWPSGKRDIDLYQLRLFLLVTTIKNVLRYHICHLSGIFLSAFDMIQPRHLEIPLQERR